MPTEGQENKKAEKKKSKLIIFALLIIVLFGGGLFGVYHFYGERILKKETQEGAGKKAEKKGEPKTGLILSLEPFLLNLSGSLTRYAKISISLELKDPKTLDYAKKITPALRDRIIQVLATKTAETLLDASQRETIKVEISEKINSLFEDDRSVKAIYITDIVVQ
ncbi:MAG: flagellar basal body-associated FliL family protein [Desulfobacterota bacterium]|nr:flagellar basal body-associated FliL family protein [Thermodesulfobacteriota bacterium]